MTQPADENLLGSYLRERRAKLDPAALGYVAGRRRTPGLRREEVAQRANISPAWYTWLEQGRGGAPSADVLDRIARALMLTDTEREHIFFLGRGTGPRSRQRQEESITPRLQRVLDALEPNAAMIRTATWDVLAWNRAVTVMLTDYGALPPSERNVLRQMFCNPRTRGAQHDWESVARFVVGAFRLDTMRAGATREAEVLVEELSRLSPEFARIWRDNEVADFGSGLKRLEHPLLGSIEFEYSSFSVDGRADLSMVVYSPVGAAGVQQARALLKTKPAASRKAQDSLSTA